MKEGHHKVFTLFGGTKLLTCNSQVRQISGPSLLTITCHNGRQSCVCVVPQQL